MQAYSLQRGLYTFDVNSTIPDVPKGEYFVYWKLNMNVPDLAFCAFVESSPSSDRWSSCVGSKKVLARMSSKGPTMQNIQKRDVVLGLLKPLTVTAHDESLGAKTSTVRVSIFNAANTYRDNHFRLYSVTVSRGQTPHTS
eukprot:GEZU01014063.1.p2 GENE.GEZU01014063.1~~GEZU01014063.1.p2  ORF type:complete len:140 (-),score=19.68 GEZU01014063.1:188-607(-)